MTSPGASVALPQPHARGLWPAGALALLFGAVLAAAAFVAFQGRGEVGDEGSFCTIAQGILDGRLPYSGLFNEKPPLQYFWTAAVMALAEPTLAGARIAAGVTMALTVAAIVLGPLRRGAGALAVGGVMLATALIAVRLEAYRNTADATLALFYVLVAILLTRPSRTPRSALLLGALHGVALGFRQTAGASALAVLAAPQLAGRRGLFFLGVLGGLLVWLIPLAATGTLWDFVKATVLFHVGNPGAASYMNHGLDHGLTAFVWVLLLAAVAVGSAGRPRDRVWAVCWLLAAALAYFGRKEEFRLWPSAAAALAMLAWDPRLVSKLGGAPRMRVAALAGAAALIAGVTTLTHAPARQGPVDAVAGALAKLTGREDEVWAGPFSPYVYCLAQRRPASRYYFLLPWTAKAEVRGEIMRDIAARRPTLVIQRSGTAFDIDRLLPELRPLLRARYRAIEVSGGAGGPGGAGFTIYRPLEAFSRAATGSGPGRSAGSWARAARSGSAGDGL